MHVKFGLKIPNRLGKNVRKFQGGGFFLLTLYMSLSLDYNGSREFGFRDAVGLHQMMKISVASFYCR